MSLFSSLFSKKTQSYEPVNRLETLFIETGSDPSKRPEFYRSLFHFELFCLGQAKDNKDGSKSAEFQTSEVEGNQAVYAFTSEAALRWFISQKKLSQRAFVGIRASALFGMIQGKLGVLLNPGHDYTKHFTPSEITEVLQDFDSKNHVETIPAGQKLSLGQPTELPEALLRGLVSYSQKSHDICEIYFGLLGNEQGEFQYLGVIDFEVETTEEKEERALQDLFIISKGTLDRGKSISFCKLRDSGFRDAIQVGALKAVPSYFIS